MHCIDIIRIFHFAVTGVSHIADHIPGSDNTPLFQFQSVREILAKVCVIIVTFAVKAPDADAPPAILVPAKGFHIAGFYRNNRCANLSHHIMPKMRSFVSITA